MRRRLLALGVAGSIAAALSVALPASAGPDAAQAHEPLTITHYVRWVGQGSCPAGELKQSQRTTVPHPRTSTTITFTGEIPSRCGGWSIGIDKYEPALPVYVTPSQKVTYPNEDACRRPPRPPCQFVFELTLTAGPAPCTCESLTTRVVREELNFTNAITYFFKLKWTMTCYGVEKRCFGEILIDPPPGFTVRNRTLTVSCVGLCARAKKYTQTVRVGGFFPRSMWKREGRRSKVVVWKFVKTCLRDGKRVPAGIGTMTVVYDRRGITDQKKSDFNGDGKPDGR
jgi:hypothetical protein